jgi:hypothetical protein
MNESQEEIFSNFLYILTGDLKSCYIYIERDRLWGNKLGVESSFFLYIGREKSFEKSFINLLTTDTIDGILRVSNETEWCR